MTRHFMFSYATFFLLLLSATRLCAQTEKAATFFAKYEVERDALVAGDSMRVNLWLYASQPFRDVQLAAKTPKVKGGKARAVAMGQRSQRTVRLPEGVFYEMLWQQYVVASEEVGEIRFLPTRLDAKLAIIEYNPDPFAQFFGEGTREVGLVKTKCKTPALHIEVKERPKRSTQEIIHSGGRVA